jgi:hypothetical protein
MGLSILTELVLDRIVATMILNHVVATTALDTSAVCNNRTRRFIAADINAYPTWGTIRS